MKSMLSNLIARFEEAVRRLNVGRSIGPFRKFEVTVLGQQGLLIRQETLPNLRLLATTDFDAFLSAEPPLDDLFKRLLREEGLIYDEQSQYVWLPEETTFELIYDSDSIRVLSPLPLYLIVSKAVKAPQKNKQLVTSAIVQFGDELLRLFEKYHVDVEQFL